eukprot:910950-Pleurochrysis_carterae.AAC.9
MDEIYRTGMMEQKHEHGLFKTEEYLLIDHLDLAPRARTLTDHYASDDDDGGSDSDNSGLVFLYIHMHA